MKLITFLILMVLFLAILIASGEVIINNIPYRIIVYIGSYRIGQWLEEFLDWNFKDISIPQSNNF